MPTFQSRCKVSKESILIRTLGNSDVIRPSHIVRTLAAKECTKDQDYNTGPGDAAGGAEAARL